jgi:hypothetical protein
MCSRSLLSFPVAFVFLFRVLTRSVSFSDRFNMSDPSAASTSLVGVPTPVATPIAEPDVQVPIAEPDVQVISVTMDFGDASYEFSSPFSMETVEDAIVTASAIALASGDSNARVLRDGVVVFAPDIVPQDIPESDFCLEVRREYPSAFDVGNGLWVIYLEFVFGSSLVTINSSFPSHLMPWARLQAHTMIRAIGTCERHYLQPPAHYPM